MFINMFVTWLLLFSCLFVIIQNLEVIPSKPEVIYTNSKYIKDVKIQIQRKGRGSPYYVNVMAEITSEWGNNVTFGFETFELLGGNYVPILFKMEKELCAFFNEPVIGRMIVNQLPKNLSTCPVPAGRYNLPNLLVHLENLPINIPFTYGAVEVRGKVEIKVHITGTKESIVYLIIHGRAIQKPKNKQ